MTGFQLSCVVIICILTSFCTLSLGAESVFPGNTGVQWEQQYLVPNIVHQTYDYHAPNFFLYLSLLCVQRFVKPDKHILWVNDEGRFRMGHWRSWQDSAVPDTWEYNMTQMINDKTIEVKFRTFPAHPPGNHTTFAPDKAHRSDFVRMDVLDKMGGMYFDTDAFPIASLNRLRIHNFTIGFDNIVNPDKDAPKRMNNGVLLASPNALFMKLWIKQYVHFNPGSFFYDSSVVPYRLATEYPDLVHVEMSSISPLSFGFDTSQAAEALTCAIYVAPSASNATPHTNGAIWAPKWKGGKVGYSYDDTAPSEYLYQAFNQRLVLHLTMTAARGYCMMRKVLSGPKELERMPSLLGRIFRLALYGEDSFNYKSVLKATAHEKTVAFNTCRNHFGMHLTYDSDNQPRQQYMPMQL